MQAKTVLMARLLGIVSIISAVLIGCGGSDLSGYRPMEKAKKQTESGQASGSRPGIAVTGLSTPVGADVVVTDADRTAQVDVQGLPVSAIAPVNVINGADMAMLLKVAPKDAGTVAGNPPSAPASTGAPFVGTERPRVVELLIPERTFQSDAASRALRISYDDLDLLKVLNLEPVTPNAVDLMPAWLKNLNGQLVKIRGFMYPTFESEGIERFVLARDNQICCFGRDPKVYDLVQVDMKSGTTTNYIPATRAFDVVGRFKIEMIAEDGKPFGLYFIEDARIIDR